MITYREVLGKSFYVPDPVSVAALARCYRGVAQDAGDAQAKLTALATPQAWAGWTGQAADTFSRKIGVLPGQLDKACQSYGTVALALTEYASQLEPVVAALTTLVNQAEDAEGALYSTMAACDQAIQQGQDPQAIGLNTRLNEAQANVDSLKRRMAALLGELNGLSHQCVTRIRQAQAEGIQNNAITDLQVAGMVGEKIGIGAANVVKNVGDDLFVHPFTKLAHDVANFDPARPFESWGAIAGDLAAVVGVLAFIPGIGEVAGVLSLGLTAAAIGLDAAAAVTHENGASWSDVGSQAEDLGLQLAFKSVSHVLGAGVTREGNLLQNAWGHRDLAQLSDLAYGQDARVSATALLSNGIKRTFSVEDIRASLFQDVKVDDPMSALKNDASAWRYVGGDTYTHSPAGASFQHFQFITDKSDALLSHIHDIQTAQKDEGGQPLWQ